jgi:hypothetical protein
LREAIIAANTDTASGAVAGECIAGSGNDTIKFQVGPNGTINLQSQLPVLSTSMTIDGLGAGQITIVGGNVTSGGSFGNFNVFAVNVPSPGIVTLSGLTITGGQVIAHTYGGGISIGGTGTVNISKCAITKNISTSGGGGGIANFGATLNITNSTIAYNAALFGPGIYNSGGTINISNSTVSGNGFASAMLAAVGGGIYNDTSGTVRLRNTIVALNGLNTPSASPDLSGSFISQGHNLISNNAGSSGFTTGTSNSNGDLVGVNPRLGQLANNGGSSQTLPLMAGSPALDAGDNCVSEVTHCGDPNTPQLTMDQRGTGFSRIFNGTVDIGAFEAHVIVEDITDKTVNEDSHLSFNFNLVGAITNVSAASDDTSLIPNDPSHLAITGTGSQRTLTIIPVADAFGATHITVTVSDANGESMTDTFLLTVNAVNDAPSFTKGADQTVLEDSSTQTVASWATSISVGPTNESGQTVTFLVTNNNNALFSSQPAVSSNGTLTYTPAANANGSATVTVTAKDNGGTANGGNDTSASQTFTITVTAVNDPPSFSKGPNQIVNEDAGAQTVTNWATSISAGPADESSQTVTFTVTNNNNGLFSSQPAVSSTGTLAYTTAVNANGSATVTVTAKDNGGTANGGNDTSASQTFTITVNAVNDAPSFTKGADQSTYNTAGTQTVANWASNISAGPADEAGQTLTFQVTGNTNASLFTAGPAISSTGTLTYTPSSTSGGTATITVNLKDSGGTANGGVDTSASQTFNITTTPAGGFLSFQSSSSNTTESSGSTTVNVVRTGDTTMPVTVNYATNSDAGVPCSTSNGVASPKCDFTAALGTLSFAIGETSKPITILISQDSFVEGPEVITLTLSSPTGGAALGTPATMSVTIADDATEPPTNIIDDPNMFVRMHYHDFLNREGDQSGIDFWTGQMSNCGSPDLLVCRVNVSGAFFLSIEFQQTGYLVERIYKTGYGDATGTSTIGGSHQIFVPVVRANEFLADTQRVGRGVVVGQTGWETVLENNKQAYAQEFVQTSRFITAFPTTMTPAQFVDKLNTNAGGVLSVNERQSVINLFGNSVNTANVTARAQALRQVAEDPDLQSAEFNRAFVLAQYIGYLRRNPNDAPDSDYTGYDFWYQKLNQFNGDYVAAEMVKAFIAADEYRHRFGQ